MNKQKLRDSLYYHVRLFPVARCKIPGGPWLPKIDRDWFVQRVDPAGIVHLSNTGSGHVAILGHDRIHHFEYEPQRDGDGNRHGMYILRTQLVIHGNEIHYLPLMHPPSPDRTPNASERRSTPTR
jgi:hypothetical protein